MARMKYTVISAPKLPELIEKVQALVDQGWRPQGGIHETSDGVYGHYLQALVKG